MQQIDYENYDTLNLYVKKIKAEEIKERYKNFGWILFNEQENATYEDILDLTFTRPHKIENKDELQLMQVYMEERINSIGKIERHKHSKSTSIGLCLGTFTLLLLALGLWLIITQYTITSSLVFGIISTAFSVFFIVLEAVFFPKLIKHENKSFKEKYDKLYKEADDLCKKAINLRGNSHEQN